MIYSYASHSLPDLKPAQRLTRPRLLPLNTHNILYTHYTTKSPFYIENIIMGRRVKHPKKSLLLTYILWLFGGIFGWHHLYLNRQTQAYLYSTTMGCMLLGWLRDFWRIPSYVQQASRADIYVELMKLRMRQRPPSSFFRGLTMFMFSNYLGALSQAPLGFIEPTIATATSVLTSAGTFAQTYTHPSSLSVYPLWWILLSSTFSAIGSTGGVIIVGRIDGQRTANYWYMIIAAFVGAMVDIVLVACTNLEGLAFLQYLCPLVIWQRSCEWVPSVFDKRVDKRVIWFGKYKKEVTCSMPLVVFIWMTSSLFTYFLMILYVYNYTLVIPDPQADLGFHIVGRSMEPALYEFVHNFGIPIDLFVEPFYPSSKASLANLEPQVGLNTTMRDKNMAFDLSEPLDVSIGAPISSSNIPAAIPQSARTSILPQRAPMRLRDVLPEIMSSRFVRSAAVSLQQAKEIFLHKGFLSGIQAVTKAGFQVDMPQIQQTQAKAQNDVSSSSSFERQTEMEPSFNEKTEL